jgi:hypothetical protein
VAEIDGAEGTADVFDCAAEKAALDGYGEFEELFCVNENGFRGADQM